MESKGIIEPNFKRAGAGNWRHHFITLPNLIQKCLPIFVIVAGRHFLNLKSRTNAPKVLNLSECKNRETVHLLTTHQVKVNIQQKALFNYLSRKLIFL